MLQSWSGLRYWNWRKCVAVPSDLLKVVSASTSVPIPALFLFPLLLLLKDCAQNLDSPP